MTEAIARAAAETLGSPRQEANGRAFGIYASWSTRVPCPGGSGGFGGG